MRRTLPLLTGACLGLVLCLGSCGQSGIDVSKPEGAVTPLEAVAQEENFPLAAYRVQEKSLRHVPGPSEGLPGPTIEVRFPCLVGEGGAPFLDSLNAAYEKRAAEWLEELQAADPDMLDVLGERQVTDSSLHYTLELATVKVNVWKNGVLHILQEAYRMTNEEQLLGMTSYECLSFDLSSGRLLSTEDVFQPGFARALKPRAKELLEINGVNAYWIETDLENLHLDVRHLVLKEDGSFAYLYGIPIPHGRASYEEIAFTPEEAKQLLKI